MLFFIPYGLITAELGSTYTEQGGLYGWIKRAFGEKWAARSTWYYWINVALWMPSVYILFAGMFAQLFFPDMGLWAKILIGIAMTWVTVWIGTITLEAGKWVPNIGAFLKVAIMLVLGIGGIVYAIRNGVANEISFATLMPSWGAGLAFLPVIVYNFMGFELMFGAGEEMENPGRDIPMAIITSGGLIAFFYLLATLGILLALPLDQIGLVSGIIDTLKAIVGDSGFGGVLVTILGVGALYTFLANMVTWPMGLLPRATKPYFGHCLLFPRSFSCCPIWRFFPLFSNYVIPTLMLNALTKSQAVTSSSGSCPSSVSF